MSLVEQKEIDKEGKTIISDLENELFDYLRSENPDSKNLDEKIQAIYDFASFNAEHIRKSARPRVVRFINDVSESIDNLIGVHNHRTPISLKAYCLIFIYIFPSLSIVVNVKSNVKNFV